MAEPCGAYRHLVNGPMSHVARTLPGGETAFLASARCVGCHQVLVGIDTDGNGRDVQAWRTLTELLAERARPGSVVLGAVADA